MRHWRWWLDGLAESGAQSRTFSDLSKGRASERGAAFFFGVPMFRQRLIVDAMRHQLTHVLEQTNRPAILATLQEMRKAEPMADREGLGRWALSIPFEDWLALRGKYPELASTDVTIKTRAYQRFMTSAESMPYRVRETI
jgi:hypothetical protein